VAGSAVYRVGRGATAFRLATFTTDVTPPLGEPLLGGTGGPHLPAQKIDDPLFAGGLVLLGRDKPLVVVEVDLCEIRNLSYQRWQTAIAAAAGTDPHRVLLTSGHMHNAPLQDALAERIVEEYGITGKVCTRTYEEQCIQRTANAVRQGIPKSARVTHYGYSQAKVDRVASNRRAVLPDGKITFMRFSTTRDPAIRNAPEDLIDPYLKTLSFWDGSRPVAALSCYSCHPQTHFGKGNVSSDFTGLARLKRQEEIPGVFQVLTRGCSGDTTVGKYNDGDPQNVPLLAERLRAGMAAAWKDVQKEPLTGLSWRFVPLHLKMNDTDDLSEAAENRTLADKSQKYPEIYRAALGLSWRRWAAQGHNIEIPAVDFGAVKLVLAPAEAFVQYQLSAQRMRPDSFVIVMGYGECTPGYIPTKKAVAEGWKDHAWEWADPPTSEDAMLPALHEALRNS